LGRIPGREWANRTRPEQETIPEQAYPKLFSFAKKPNVTFKAVVSSTSLTSHFNLPLSTQAHQQLIEIQNFINNVPMNGDLDIQSYTWGQCRP
jgi:hypothetical protein